MDKTETPTNWPCLTRDIPAISGQIKSYAEDFQVEEIPQYECSGTGTHVYFLIEKKNITTLDLIRQLARKLRRNENDFGYAGLKDSHAVTRQRMSLEHADPSELEKLDLPEAKILDVGYHTNKLKLGHLAGNRFLLKVRNFDQNQLDDAKKCLEVLERRGVPNYFGSQRFGVRGDNWILGRAILREDFEDFLCHICGRPTSIDNEIVRRARKYFDQGRYDLAAETWPGFFRDAKKACRILAADPKAHEKAFNAVNKRLRKLFVSAYQAWLFNKVLARRIDSIDQLQVGDLAYKHVNGAVFVVEDPEQENPRLERFEISPSGPLYGYRIKCAEGEPGKIEQEVLEDQKVKAEDFRSIKGHKIKGSRRPLRVPVRNLKIDCGEDDSGSFLQLKFDMPSGAYATAVLKELMKTEPKEADGE